MSCVQVAFTATTPISIPNSIPVDTRHPVGGHQMTDISARSSEKKKVRVEKNQFRFLFLVSVHTIGKQEFVVFKADRFYFNPIEVECQIAVGAPLISVTMVKRRLLLSILTVDKNTRRRFLSNVIETQAFHNG